MTKKANYSQHHTHTDLKLVLGYLSCVFALGGGGYTYYIPFEESKQLTLICVAAYPFCADEMKEKKDGCWYYIFGYIYIFDWSLLFFNLQSPVMVAMSLLIYFWQFMRCLLSAILYLWAPYQKERRYSDRSLLILLLTMSDVSFTSI